MKRWIGRAWTTVRDAVRRFFEKDGGQWAHAFAFNALFSIAPLVAVVVALASGWAEPAAINAEIVAYVGRYVPVSGQMQQDVLDTVTGVVSSRGRVGVVSFLVLLWVAVQCYVTLVLAINRMWGLPLVRLWRVPLKSLVGLGLTMVAMIAGTALPVLWRVTRARLFPDLHLDEWLEASARDAVPLLVVFGGTSAFYMLAPRREMRFREVAVPALVVTLLLGVAKSLFVVYLENFSSFNAVYGALGGVMALLLWIDISGALVIFGSCLCACAVGAPSERPALGDP